MVRCERPIDFHGALRESAMKTVFRAAIITALVLTQHAYPQEPATLEQLEKQRRLLEQQLSQLEKQSRLLAEQLSQEIKAYKEKTAKLEYIDRELQIAEVLKERDLELLKKEQELLKKAPNPSTYFDGIQWELRHRRGSLLRP
jgi:hypothetical protein